MRIRFDYEKFRKAVLAARDVHGQRGFSSKLIAGTGISHGTANRLLHANKASVNNTSSILSVCDFLGLDFNSFVENHRGSKQVTGFEIATETIYPDYVARGFRKGYMDRNFYVGGREYKWIGNVPYERGIVRVGVMV